MADRSGPAGSVVGTAATVSSAAPGRPPAATAAPAPLAGPAGGWRSPRGRERLLQLGVLVPAGGYLLGFFGFPGGQDVAMAVPEDTNRTLFTREAAWGRVGNYMPRG